MENTLENKAKFFALYWGQNVFRHSLIKNNGVVDLYSLSDRNVNPLYSYLELAPLSQITDEHALECYNLHFLSHIKNDIRPNESKISFAKKHIVKPIEVCIPIVIDYLRSKGYALPWMGLTVEQLDSFGWVKLKEATNEH